MQCNLRNKLKLILFGLVLLLFILELSLYILNRFANYKSNESNWADLKNSYNILCIGDSFTYGIGTKENYSYPKRLADILKINFPKDRFNVVNLGIPGANSSQILKNLSDNIKRYHPNLVIIWAGVDNCWNLTDSNYFLFTDKANTNISLKRMEYFLSKLRTYKLLKIIMINLSRKMRVEKHSEPVNHFYILSEKEEKLLHAAQIIIEKNRMNKSSVEDGVLRKLKIAYDINKNPDPVIALLKRYYSWKDFSDVVSKFLLLVKDKNKLKEILDTGTYIGNNFEYNLGNKYYDKQIFDKLLEHDLRKMITLIKENKAKALLLTYTSNNIERGSDNVIIRAVAHKCNIPCVDLEPLFGKILVEHKFEEYFVPDGHLNSIGYRLVAEEVYKNIKSKSYLKKKLL